MSGGRSSRVALIYAASSCRNATTTSNLSQWPMEAEQEALEAAATDVQRMPTTKDALKHKYQKRFGLSASKDLFVKDCELLGACLYTGPMVRMEVVSSNQSDFTPAPLMHA